MKNVKWINGIAVGLPLLFLVLSIFNEGYLLFVVLILLVTGLTQLLVALYLLIEEVEVKRIRAYYLMVALYFIIFYFSESINMFNGYYLTLSSIPAAYLSYIIHKK